MWTAIPNCKKESMRALMRDELQPAQVQCSAVKKELLYHAKNNNKRDARAYTGHSITRVIKWKRQKKNGTGTERNSKKT